MSTLEYIAAALIALGTLFFCGAAMGVLRLPDCYTRMHAAGKGDTLSSLLILGGLALMHLEDFTLGHLLVSLKMLGIVLFIFITSPTSSHAIMQAGHRAGIKPWLKPRKKNR